MQSLILPLLFVLILLVAFIGYAVVVVWRRLRLLEARLAAMDEQAGQGRLLLSEYMAALEQVGEEVLRRVRAESAALAAAQETGETRERIRLLAAQGLGAREIARRLGLGVGEVQLILDLERLPARQDPEERANA